MKLKYDFEIMNIDEDYIAIPFGEDSGKINAVIRLNSTAVDIFQLLKEEITEDILLEKLADKYNSTSKEDINEFLRDFLAELSANEILE